ncbi:hypothetical protein ANN_01233 [Periplaneta americana]|uniref:DUF4817 domain-containing protein n=1 Tax=Periplaneta americana TaxID=6978 RepID=A0ABQ8TUT4_PERAM|nr:hypothetical protein ANN_01233 [Periplaneta americana]
MRPDDYVLIAKRGAASPNGHPYISDNASPLPSKETLRGHSDSSFRGEGYIQCCVGVRLCDMYSNQELAEIHFMYGKADDNAALARRLYQERYPQRQCPDRKTFVRLHYRLCENGKFNSPGLGRGRPRSTTPEVQEEILEAMNMTPSISTQRVALQVNVPHTTVWRLLKEYQLRTARRYLDRRFPDRWIGRGGPIAWPPRSPDLNPLDFYLWGHLKSLVYSSPVPDLESLRNRIVACSGDIRNTPGVWDRVHRDTGFKLTNAEKRGLGCFCVFGVGLLYVEAWFLTRLSTAAPASDLGLLKLLVAQTSPAAKSALKKVCGHLWYLS